MLRMQQISMLVKQDIPEQIRRLRIDRLGLPTRVYNALIRAGVNTIEQLLSLSTDDLLQIRGIGKTAEQTIIASLNNLSSMQILNLEINQSHEDSQVYLESPEKIKNIIASLSTIAKDTPISYLHLSTKTYNTLSRSGIVSLEHLLNAVQGGFVGFSRLGTVSKREIVAAIQTLTQSVNETGEIDWIKYFHIKKIVIIPKNYQSGTSRAQQIQYLPDLVKEILHQSNNDRGWRIIQRRFGLNGTKRLTLEDLGKIFGLTRERVRQIEQKVLSELRQVLLENQYSDQSYHIHPDITSTLRLISSVLANKIDDFIKETALISLVQEIINCDVSQIQPVLKLIFVITGMTRIEFDNSNLSAVWSRSGTEQQHQMEQIIIQLDKILTTETVEPLSDMDILLQINKKLPKGRRLTLSQLQKYLHLCSTIEQRDDGLFWGKFEYIKSRGNQAERLLLEKGIPQSGADLARMINNRLVPKGHRKLSERNLVNQLQADHRFVPIGRSGLWALKKWDVETNNIIDLMERYLIERNQPATPEEIFYYVNSKRPVKLNSIQFYLTQSKLFRKIDRERWGLASWREAKNAINWNPEQVANFVADLFKQKRTESLEFRIVKEALMEKAGINERQASGLLRINPVIEVRKDPRSSVRIAFFQPDYQVRLATKGARPSRKKPTQQEKLEKMVYELLENTPNGQLPLNDIITILKKHGFHEKTSYLYLRRANSIETITIPGTKTKLCRLKNRLSLSFPRVSEIIDADLRTNIEKALVDLNEENVDLGLFQLGREFESVLKSALVYGIEKGKVNPSVSLGRDPSKWKLANMIDCARDNNLIKESGVVHLLRQERNNRAHGSRPSLEERQALMNAAPYIAGMYIDYIILFEKFKRD